MLCTHGKAFLWPISKTLSFRLWMCGNSPGLCDASVVGPNGCKSTLTRSTVPHAAGPFRAGASGRRHDSPDACQGGEADGDSSPGATGSGGGLTVAELVAYGTISAQKGFRKTPEEEEL